MSAAVAETSKIFARVLKLRALASNANTNAHESASALAMAARLMEKHDIEEAALIGADARPEEYLSDDEAGFATVYRGSRIAAWRCDLAVTCARATGCYSYRSSLDGVHCIAAVGRREDLAKYHALYGECAAEIERLAIRLARRRGRLYLKSFRLGCVKAISDAFRAEQESLHEELRGLVSETAIAVVTTRCDIAKETLGKISEGRKRGPVLVDSGAFESGRAAGSGIFAGATRKKIPESHE